MDFDLTSSLEGANHPNLKFSTQYSGFVYDERMTEHKCLWDLKYNEKPERLTRIFERYVFNMAFLRHLWLII